MYIYGIKTREGEHIDISKSERGAKCYATRHGYAVVTKRNANHYYVVEVAKKIGNNWHSLLNADNILSARTC